jgi:hypothetical protein
MRRGLLALKLSCKDGAKQILDRLGGLDMTLLIAILLFAMPQKLGVDALKEYGDASYDRWPIRQLEKRNFLD